MEPLITTPKACLDVPSMFRPQVAVTAQTPAGHTAHFLCYARLSATTPYTLAHGPAPGSLQEVSLWLSPQWSACPRSQACTHSVHASRLDTSLPFWHAGGLGSPTTLEGRNCPRPWAVPGPSALAHRAKGDWAWPPTPGLPPAAAPTLCTWMTQGGLSQRPQPTLVLPSTCHPLSVCWVFYSFRSVRAVGWPHPEPSLSFLSGLFHPLVCSFFKKKSNRSQRPRALRALAAPHPTVGPVRQEWQTLVSAPPPVSLRLVSGLGLPS